MDREQAKKLIGGLFGEAADDVPTERLEVMRREVASQMDAVQSRGLYQKVLDALDLEIGSRQGVPGTETERVRPQTQAETKVSGYPGDEPGELRHGVRRDAAMKWRVKGR